MNTTTSFFSQVRIAITATVVLAILVGGIYPLIVWGAAQVLFPSQANGSLLSQDGKVVGSQLIGQPFSTAGYFQPRPSAAGNGYDPTQSGGSNLGPTSAKLFLGTTKIPTPAAPAAPTPDATPAVAAIPAPAAPAATPIVPAAATPAAPVAPVVDYDGITLRVLHYCDDNGLPFSGLIDGKPIDLAPYRTAQGWDEVKLIQAFNDAKAPLTIHAGTPIPVDAVTSSASGLDPHISEANALLQIPRVAKARNLGVPLLRSLVANFTEHSLLGEPGVNVLRLNLALDTYK